MLVNWRKWLGILAIGFCLARTAHGQAGTATLSGVIVDQSGGTLSGVEVIAVSAVSGLQRHTTSDAEGRFVIAMVPAGPYSVTAQRSGFAAAQVKQLLLAAGEDVAIRLELK